MPAADYYNGSTTAGPFPEPSLEKLVRTIEQRDHPQPAPPVREDFLDLARLLDEIDRLAMEISETAIRLDKMRAARASLVKDAFARFDTYAKTLHQEP